MSRLAYTRPLGVWNAGIVRSSELADLDAKTVKAPNFEGGGTYAPSAPIIVGGAGMSLHLVGNSNAEGMFVTVVLDSAFGSAANFRGNTSFYSGSHTVIRSGAFFEFQNGTTTTFDSGAVLNVAGQAHFTGAFSAVGVGLRDLVATNSVDTQTLRVHADAHFTGSFDAIGVAVQDLVITGSLAFQSGGSIIERVVIGANAAATYSVSSADLVYVPDGTISADRTYFLDEVANNGMKIRFYRADQGAPYIRLKRSVDSSQICRLTWNSSGYIWVDVQRIAGVWQIVGGQIGPNTP